MSDEPLYTSLLDAPLDDPAELPPDEGDEEARPSADDGAHP